jgi:hypothetical protein
MSRTAIVILNHNGEKLLPQFLPSVVQYSNTAEIIVADNASTDQSIPFLRKEYPAIRLILLDQNYGFCGGYNRALSQVDADYFVLLNSDVEVTEGWLDPMIELLDNDERIAAVQPKILSYTNRNKFEHAGAGGGLIDSLGYPFCRGRIFDQVESDSGQYDDVTEIFWATGACMIIRAETFRRFDGFDDDFFAHMEEIDLCWKIHRVGQKVCYYGKSTVYHVGAGTLEYGNPRKVFLNFRNGLSMVYKHWSRWELMYKLPTRVALDWVAAAAYLVKGQPQSCGAVFRAHYRFLRNLGGDRKKRQKIQKTPRYNGATIIRGLILVDHYLFGKKGFP